MSRSAFEVGHVLFDRKCHKNNNALSKRHRGALVDICQRIRVEAATSKEGSRCRIKDLSAIYIYLLHLYQGVLIFQTTKTAPFGFQDVKHLNLKLMQIK